MFYEGYGEHPKTSKPDDGVDKATKEVRLRAENSCDKVKLKYAYCKPVYSAEYNNH